ncbi:MBOAT family O-acyltransferase, partial [Verrucomicrobiota bacterium]
MWFNSIDFLLFILLVLPVFYALGAFPALKGRARTLFLLAASYYFYMYWNPIFVVLILATTTINYACGLALETWPRRMRRWLVAFSAAGSLGILGYFKYGKFLYGTLGRGMDCVGVDLPPFPEALGFALPVGISFYTFQSMSYTIDLYRGRIRAERDFCRFALFVAYFPQLVAGPIEKAHHLLGEIRRGVTRGRPVDVMGAIQQISYGLFKKVAIADSIAIVVDPVFSRPADYGGLHILMAAVLFSFQIYCDFSGYSDIGIGISKLFGIRISTNFFFPYFATNITRFWRTWHISLSSWLKDYLYIPLGGNRKGTARQYANLMTTMLLGGLWHGASWNFMLWGGLHGLCLALHKRVSAARPARRPSSRSLAVAVVLAKGLFTFLLVSILWLPFRCRTFGDTLLCLRRVVSWDGGRTVSPPLDPGLLVTCWLLVAVLLLIDAFYRLEYDFWQRKKWVNYVKCALPPVFILLT